MGLFKKKNSTPALFTLLDNEYLRARTRGENCFYHLLDNNERDLAEKWCRKNNIYMEMDHQTDGNIFYKFKF
jgi:hypothetical protein